MWNSNLRLSLEQLFTDCVLTYISNFVVCLHVVVTAERTCGYSYVIVLQDAGSPARHECVLVHAQLKVFHGFFSPKFSIRFLKNVNSESILMFEGICNSFTSSSIPRLLQPRLPFFNSSSFSYLSAIASPLSARDLQQLGALFFAVVHAASVFFGSLSIIAEPPTSLNNFSTIFTQFP